ncbi:FAD-binding oxidoreductase [Pedobacter sp. MC2016-14]|uniref:FAD-binding oxidoreductase n=1 Tax=Pedobacter sp. MC2016-14 TaxID=2897327 RepID=UPI001E46732B|nr:FAD-binding oxidoreductase [Pedobacter sp. MC2016-14]MCD0489079.1 FAD-binding oxidoreductase [Pedobacter sp. MC2016-14]
MKSKSVFKKVISLIFILLFIFLLRPIGFLLYTWIKDDAIKLQNEYGTTQDASRLNRTKIDTLIKVNENHEATTAQITELIKKAHLRKKNIAIAGAQHSMGGHTIYKGGILLDMKGFNYLRLDSTNNILHVGSGALWVDVIKFLDDKNRSVFVMQSNNSFSIGGSVSVNCHGWQAMAGPISSTVQSFRLMNASGEILNCSRKENAELFSLVLGGYGLFGVILDLELKVTTNKTYTAHQYIIKSDDYVKEFNKQVRKNPNVDMAYGRINVNPDHFMEEAILCTYTDDHTIPKQLSRGNNMAGFRRTLFRGSVGSNYGKNLRWSIEKAATFLINDKKFTRNRLMNEGVEVFQNTAPDYTDILHEYFIPIEAAPTFIKQLREILPRYNSDLLNITIRYVKRDSDTFLAYANNDVFGFVMLFSQQRSPAVEREMKTLTQKLIEITADLKGTYYLPYRLHATKAQMSKAYPNADGFFNLKRKYDADEVFKNQFYQTYGSKSYLKK